MKAHRFLQAILVLAFAGLFVAGVLSLGKLLHLAVPCGVARGCDVVNNHPTSKWFNLPVAYYGFVGYLVIGGLAILRAGAPAAKAKQLALYGYLASAGGAVASIVLQVISFTVIKARCEWCLTSAAIMVLLLLSHAFEYQERSAEEVPDGKGDFKLISALAIVWVVAIAGMGLKLKSGSAPAGVTVSDGRLEKVKLIPEKGNFYGDPNSPITIIEFADMMCPSCQENSPRVKEFVQNHAGQVKLVYRHFPLETLHRLGPMAASIGEMAAEEGKFWDFMLSVMATHENIQDVDRVLELVKGVGMDVEKVKKRLSDAKDPAFKRVDDDMTVANALGVEFTPTFFVVSPGKETRAYKGYESLMSDFDSGAFGDLKKK